jgi:hypothetical protein
MLQLKMTSMEDNIHGRGSNKHIIWFFNNHRVDLNQKESNIQTKDSIEDILKTTFMEDDLKNIDLGWSGLI